MSYLIISWCFDFKKIDGGSLDTIGFRSYEERSNQCSMNVFTKNQALWMKTNSIWWKIWLFWFCEKMRVWRMNFPSRDRALSTTSTGQADKEARLETSSSVELQVVLVPVLCTCTRTSTSAIACTSVCFTSTSSWEIVLVLVLELVLVLVPGLVLVLVLVPVLASTTITRHEARCTPVCKQPTCRI